MTPEEQQELQYRFGGYQLPLVQWDATGPAYAILPPHPYFRNQPLYWQKAAFIGNSFPTYGQITGNFPIAPSGNTYPISAGDSLIDLMPF